LTPLVPPTISPQMANTVRIDLAMNDPNTGAPSGKLAAITFDPGGPDEAEWECIVENMPSCRYDPKFRTLRVSRACVAAHSFGEWAGNMCWNRVVVGRDSALRIHTLISAGGKFSCHGAVEGSRYASTPDQPGGGSNG